MNISGRIFRGIAVLGLGAFLSACAIVSHRSDSPLASSASLSASSTPLSQPVPRITQKAEYVGKPAAEQTLKVTLTLKEATATGEQRVLDFVGQNQLQVVDRFANHAMVVLEGTTANLDRAFQADLGRYQAKDQNVYIANSKPIQIPSGLNGVVRSVLGMDTSARMTTRAVQAPSAVTDVYSGPLPSLGQEFCRTFDSTSRTLNHPNCPKEIAKAYKLEPLHSRDFKGEGQRIAVISALGFYSPSDPSQRFRQIEKFRQIYGITDPLQIQEVSAASYSANPTQEEVNAGFETMMDVQWAHAMAPKARIQLYQAPNANFDSFIVEFNRAASLPAEERPNIISFSWGKCERVMTEVYPTIKSEFDAALDAAAQAGITVFAAGGDKGNYGCADVTAPTETPYRSDESADYPAASPKVFSVGGTSLHLIPGGQGAVAEERVWNQWSTYGAASGGAYSGSFAVPSWQQDLPLEEDHRGTNDLASVAAAFNPTAGDYGQAVYFEVDGASAAQCDVDPNRCLRYGSGTSVAAPTVAGIFAVLNEYVAETNASSTRPTLAGDSHELVYRLAQQSGSLAFKDIVSGDNGGFRAAAGWDEPTGWGTVRAWNIAQLLAPAGLSAATEYKGSVEKGTEIRWSWISGGNVLFYQLIDPANNTVVLDNIPAYRTDVVETNAPVGTVTRLIRAKNAVGETADSASAQVTLLDLPSLELLNVKGVRVNSDSDYNRFIDKVLYLQSDGDALRFTFASELDGFDSGKLVFQQVDLSKADQSLIETYETATALPLVGAINPVRVDIVASGATLTVTPIDGWGANRLYFLIIQEAVGKDGKRLADKRILFAIPADLSRPFELSALPMDGTKLLGGFNTVAASQQVIVRSRFLAPAVAMTPGMPRAPSSSSATRPVLSSMREVLLYESNDQLQNQFAQAVTLTIPYLANGNKVAGTHPAVYVADLQICRMTSRGELVPILSSVVNTQDQTVTAMIDASGLYVLGSSNADTLTESFAYPVPFRAARGDRTITFDNVTAGARILIYTFDGRTVVDMTASGSTHLWDVKTADGKDVGSGAYHYRITNGSSEKRGKIIVIR